MVMLGDSYTFGAGVGPEESLPARLEQRLNDGGPARYQVLNMGIPGYNTAQELTYFREKGADFRPDVVVGLHDAALGRKSEGWDRCQEALDGFGQDCRRAGVPCILVLWPMFEDLAHYPYMREHVLVRTRAEAAGFAVIDLYDVFKGQDEHGLRLSDRDSHPNALAYNQAAAVLVRFLAAHAALKHGPGSPAA